ncbi:MAG: trypsin-like peptidase domain-containing protein [Okeania sp. SIO3I5]|uniref:effector-associated domain EAD1-containing protein n=1 Tax=Okeania sp. SIO3I5 TaxID=2607805 RepID=UPI0013B62EC4|nr:effector-associated domain EAD1-containing protein [Okeania sp. SIO3I5]NEQ39558.1 trypsin-like peptidase domain-containing protein [Okeania sp. SIO3I5]
MKLTGKQRKQLRQAIISAYPNPSDLEMMVSEELEWNLSTITLGQNYNKIVFDLIEWTQAKNKLEDIICAAYRVAPDNEDLQQFCQPIIRRLEEFIIQPTYNRDYGEFGSPINLSELKSDRQLESLFKPEPNLLDVGFLRRAVDRASSVCRIELSDGRILGTGVLISNQLVLTNYHLLCLEEEKDSTLNTDNLILKFGCYSSESGYETQGYTFQLDSQTPILSSSHTNKLDYLLLQVEPKILQVSDIKPAPWDIDVLPQRRMGINILQHPEGDSMKIAISSNGVREVYENIGLIQYVSRTSGGSSGSPCFNEDWEVVALHHAQRAGSFGKICEGILFRSIYQEISSYLK